MTADIVNEPVPLSLWIRGTLTVHFAGATVRRQMTLRDAHNFRGTEANEQASDRITWSTAKWMQCDPSKILMTTFDPDEDFGWPLTHDERRALTKRGHIGGVLGTLHKHWEHSDAEPAYSALVMRYLYNLAATADMEELTEAATTLEGARGARILALAQEAEMQQAHNEPDQGPHPPEEPTAPSGQE